MAHSTLVERGLRGALGGVAATGVMSAVLGLAEKTGVMEQEPPRVIVETLLPVRPRSTLTNTLAVVAHVGYGAGAGALFAALPGRWPHGVRLGVGYGLAVWALGYEGWLPAAGVLPPAHRDRPGRAVTMLAAHVVYGGALALGIRATASARQSIGSRRAGTSSSAGS